MTTKKYISNIFQVIKPFLEEVIVKNCLPVVFSNLCWNLEFGAEDHVKYIFKFKRSSKYPLPNKSHLTICSIFGKHLYKTFTKTFSALFYAFPGDTIKNILRRIIIRNWKVEERLLFFKENALFANFWDSSLK